MNAYDFRLNARQKLKNNYIYAVLACLIASLLTGAGPVFSAVSVTGNIVEAIVQNGGAILRYRLSTGAFSYLLSLAAFIIGGAVNTGLSRYFLDIDSGRNADIEEIFSEFKNLGNTFCANLLIMLFIFLWSFLFIIPGIAAAYSYSMTFFILAEHPEMPARQALETSKRLMRGNRLRLFLLDLSFIGWLILGCIAGGVGLIFVIPYINAAHAGFFNEISGNNYERSLSSGTQTQNINNYYREDDIL